MMKKIYAAVCAILLAGAMSVTAFAVTESDVTGTWYLNSVESDGKSYNPASVGMEATLVLAEDSSCEISMSSEDAVKGKWKLDGDTISIFDTDDGSDNVNGTYADGMITLAEDDMALVFGREPAVADTYEVGAVVAEPKAEDFDGTWKATTIDMFGMQLPMSLMDMELQLEIKDGSANLMFKESESDAVEKTLTGTLEGDTLQLKNPEDPEDIEIYFDTDKMNLRLHDNGIMSYSNKKFNGEEEEDTAFAVYFEKE